MNSVATLGSGHCGAIWGSCLSFRWLRHTRAADGGRSQARTFGARTNFKIATGIRTIQNVFRDHHHETQNNVQFFSNQSRQMLFLCFVVMKIDPKNHETQNNVQFFSNQSPKMPFLCFWIMWKSTQKITKNKTMCSFSRARAGKCSFCVLFFVKITTKNKTMCSFSRTRAGKCSFCVLFFVNFYFRKDYII